MKKSVKISAAVLSAVLILGSAVGLYNTERGRVETVSDARSYILCAETTLELAKSSGIADAKPVSHAADTSGMSKMEANLTWVADYNKDLSKLDREYDELSTSPAVKSLGSGASYADACSAALIYHQQSLDDANSSAATVTAVCIAVLVIGLAGMCAVAAAKTKE